MKKFILAFVLFSYVLPFLSFAQSNNRGKYGANPIEILNTVSIEANDEYKIQQTALD